MGSWLFRYYADSGPSCTTLTWCFGLDLIALQGTKVLEDREIRHSFCITARGEPPQHASPRISKYTGDLTAPKWEDVEPGRVFIFPWHLVKSTQSSKGKFETLCHVEVDISGAPHTSNYTTEGGLGYRRDYDIILLVGLTELKAQVSWTDSRTVRVHIIPPVPIYSSICVNLGDREKVCSNIFRVSDPQAESNF